MFRFIRQLVQKLKKDTKVETQHPSSHNNGNTNVVCRIICVIVGHNKINKKCVRCGQLFGVPKMENPPAPP